MSKIDKIVNGASYDRNKLLNESDMSFKSRDSKANNVLPGT